ncbi:MAG: aldo/keto reductase [Methylococcales symbiont of Iophon sp. n. MRB-2018]|nr:MAG: aldo/keto reductase [Methylococcales symbiont of Iophon sp. n. MRB-2018]KAF3980416.1 MAG: aldo/keto reductase [Methylococcales symbiont of Iophon sp. n. MRB-2018]
MQNLDSRLEKLAIGTVQFGVNYGVTNTVGQTPISGVRNIINLAKQHNINTIDTSPAYGNSEAVLGEVGVNNWQIITKTIPLTSTKEVIDRVNASLKQLKQNSIHGLLIHNIDDIYKNNFQDLFTQLSNLKYQGVIKKIGFSCYTPNQVDFLLANFEFDIIQVPLNIFDQRLIQGDQLKKLKENGVEIHTRSVFLQGVLLDFDNLTNYFSTWHKQFTKYQLMVESSGLSLLEYALNFALNIKEIDKILVGVNSQQQLQEIITASTSKNQTELKPFNIDDINLLNPALWKL